MKDDLIGLFIDDEMDLGNKIEFVETVHESKPFADDAIDLLQQEKMLKSEWVTHVPTVQIKTARNIFPRWLRPIAAFSTVLVVFAVALFLYNSPGIKSGTDPVVGSVTKKKVSHRFVIYRPDARQAEIIGTFTDWHPITMESLSSSGYWTVTLNLFEGEHRYSYLVEDGRQIADPTVLSRERDDFGGENSIIEVKSAI